MHLVKIIKDEDGEKRDDLVWCAVICDDADRTLCSGEAFGEGESHVEYREKFTGKVTCRRCIEKLNFLKKYKY